MQPSPPTRIHLRIARPVANLTVSVAAYKLGLELAVLGSFDDHGGFDGVMLGQAGMDFHFEFTTCRAHPVQPAQTEEDLLIFYYSEPKAWNATCARMEKAGFKQIASFNPYWDRVGRTYQDTDGYRIVIQMATWGEELVQ